MGDRSLLPLAGFLSQAFEDVKDKNAYSGSLAFRGTSKSLQAFAMIPFQFHQTPFSVKRVFDRVGRRAGMIGL